MQSRSTLTIGAFMALGLQDTIHASGDILDHWRNGHYELVHAMMQHAPYCRALLDAGFRLVQESSGVAVYEVAEEFGAWYGKAVKDMDHGTEPDAATCRAKLRVLVTTFYNPMNSAALNAVLNSVQIPESYE